jgi:uncharacterized membrane protein YebE (DUF533 family)
MASQMKRSNATAGERNCKQAVAAVLVCAASADGSVLPVEADRLEEAISSMRLFADSSERELQGFIKELHEEVVRDGAIEVARHAAAFVPHELRLKVFGLAADLVFTDRRERTSERLFLEQLRRALGIGRHIADDVIRTMTTKYCS